MAISPFRKNCVEPSQLIKKPFTFPWITYEKVNRKMLLDENRDFLVKI